MTSIPGEQPPKPQIISNLSIRVITAIILLPLILFASYTGGWLLALIIGSLSIVGALEFYFFAQGRQMQGSALMGAPMVALVTFAFYTQDNRIWIGALVIGSIATLILETVRHPGDVRRTLWQLGATLAGVLYVAFPAAFLLVIRAIEGDGLMWLFLVFASTWGTDTFAYLGGRLFGRTKLAPVLSPNKTVEGAVVGLFGGILSALIILIANNRLTTGALIVICLAPLVAIAGDLFESAMKRFFKVKDSHIHGLNIFPGHGGVLDRVDSLLCVSTLYYVYLILSGTIG